ncbi:MAG: Fic family protein [Candidatus Eisenbacteria bacterium]|uniref:Fic family protein n=1 Tax=Eiseniibacteriota bacterium TaxID=2212470 RepID=A0A937X972_UNCEI|nr:Fic family protein [Candidatus Eisenbacteria bacterium]
MMTLRQFARRPKTVGATAAWYLSDLGQARGRQDLFTRQSPQTLKTLREHAMVESAVSSNRIEGVEVDRARIGTIVFGKALLRDRGEEEVRGYRNALQLIHERGRDLPVSEETIRGLHRVTRGEIWDAGVYKDRDGDIIERFPDGRERIRFRTVPAARTPACMGELVELWQECLDQQWVHPLLALGAFNLDLLCIHPFRDGNGRVSRLLLLLQAYHLGYEVGRYISLERTIEENKERYYETLERSSQGWHESGHDPWPYLSFILYILKTAYAEFERRVGEVKSPRGVKTERIRSAVDAFAAEFTLADLERACPGVSRDLIRRVLRGLRAAGDIECLGRGPGAQWRKGGTTPKKG